MSIGTSVVKASQPELLKEEEKPLEPRTRLDHQPKGKTGVDADSGRQELSLAMLLFPFLSPLF